MSIRSRPRRSLQEATLGGLGGKLRLPFASCYVYSPHGQDPLSARSRVLCVRLKGRDPCSLQGYVSQVCEQVRAGCFPGFFGAGSMLVPIPASRPAAHQEQGVAECLALAMQGCGLGGSVWTGLRRTRAVPRSSRAWRWHRPTVLEHLQSLSFDAGAGGRPGNLVLIDDVVTKGRTLIAAAIRLHMAWPVTPIRAFALMRTMGLEDVIQRLIDPCEGEICWDGMDVCRTP